MKRFTSSPGVWRLGLAKGVSGTVLVLAFAICGFALLGGLSSDTVILSCLAVLPFGIAVTALQAALWARTARTSYQVDADGLTVLRDRQRLAHHPWSEVVEVHASGRPRPWTVLLLRDGVHSFPRAHLVLRDGTRRSLPPVLTLEAGAAADMEVALQQLHDAARRT